MNRTGHVSRVTRETRIDLDVDLDGLGSTEVSTGIGMFDHLLASLGHRVEEHAFPLDGELMMDHFMSIWTRFAVSDYRGVWLQAAERGDAKLLVDGDFSGLSWFPIDEAYRVEARWVSYPVPRPLREAHVRPRPAPAADRFDSPPLRVPHAVTTSRQRNRRTITWKRGRTHEQTFALIGSRVAGRLPGRA